MQAASRRLRPAWTRPLSGDRLAFAGAHHLLLELLIGLVHAAEHGAGATIADALAVELDDGEHFLGRRGDPDLVGGAHFRFADGAELERHAVRGGKLDDHVVGDAGQDQVALGRRLDHAALDDENVRGRSLGELAVAEQDGLYCAGIGRELPQQAVAEERDRLDVAAQPAVVLRAHRGAALLHLRLRRVDERVRHHEHGGLDVLRQRMVALGDAARDLEVHALVVERLRVDQLVDMGAPLGARVRVADLRLAEAALQTRQVLVEAERHARIDRHQLVDPVAEDEPAVEHRDARLLGGKQLAIEKNRHFSHSLSVSQVRRKKPAAATGSSATSGYSPNSAPSCVTRSTPTRCPFLSGATSGCCETSSALSLSASPLGTLTNRSVPTPTFTVRLSPFQTSSGLTGLPALKSFTASKN